MRFSHALLLSFFLLLTTFSIQAQKKVTFPSFDGLTVTADLYETDKNLPFILLFHQAGYSRGEYREIAKRLLKLGFNCLAVDLRSGGEVNFVRNETAALAVKEGKPNKFIDAEKDILAAIDFAFYRNYKEVVLFGSSYSASLCLKIGKNNPKVKSVVAFSPGEFFKPEMSMKDELKGFNKKVFVASSKREYQYMLDMFTYVSSRNKNIFKPNQGDGEHGAKNLWTSNPTSREYWLAMLMYFRQVKELY